MNDIIILIRKSYENWDNLNPVLAIGEIGIISAGKDLGKRKNGDGVTAWRDLDYATVGDSGGGIGVETDPVFLAALPSLATKVEINDINNNLEGVDSIPLAGALLTRIIGGITEIPKNLFLADTIFIQGKTSIFDVNGTIGFYVNDVDSATIRVITKTTSPIGVNEPVLIGQVPTFADLPFTVTDIEIHFGRTPNTGDYIQVINDETHNDKRVEWYIADIDVNGDITWGNPVVINDSDYQQQTTAADAGKVLTGGATPGTFGESIGIDNEPIEDSDNLVKSGGIFLSLKDLIVSNFPPSIGLTAPDAWNFSFRYDQLDDASLGTVPPSPPWTRSPASGNPTASTTFSRSFATLKQVNMPSRAPLEVGLREAWEGLSYPEMSQTLIRMHQAGYMGSADRERFIFINPNGYRFSTLVDDTGTEIDIQYSEVSINAAISANTSVTPNWMLGNLDTGLPASGAPGLPGSGAVSYLTNTGTTPTNISVGASGVRTYIYVQGVNFQITPRGTATSGVLHWRFNDNGIVFESLTVPATSVLNPTKGNRGGIIMIPG